MDEDWRLRGQEDYLRGKTLYFLPFEKRSSAWDHEHCEFCWDKFSDSEGDLHEGWCTEATNTGRACWICPTCFRDFRERFQWRVAATPNK